MGFSCIQHRQTLKKASCAPNTACCFSSSVSWPDKSYGLSPQTQSALVLWAFFGCWLLISNQKAGALPSLQQHKAELKAVRCFGRGEQRLKCVLERSGCRKNGHWASAVPLLGTHKERFVTVTCPSIATGCPFPWALLSFWHLLLGLSTACEIPEQTSLEPSHQRVPQGWGDSGRLCPTACRLCAPGGLSCASHHVML